MILLLSEGSVRLRGLLTERIRAVGWMFDSVASVAAAMKSTRSIPYDLALIVLGLSDGEGKSLILSLREQGSSGTILVLTAPGSIEDRVASLDCRADDFLIKPFNHIELLALCGAAGRIARSVPWGSPMAWTTAFAGLMAGHICGTASA